MSLRKIYLSTIIAGLTTFAVAPSVSAAGFNIGADYGRTEAKKYCEHITNCEDSDNGPKIEVGYDFNRNWALELGYTSFGTNFDSKDNAFTASQDSRAITLSVIGLVPLGDMWGIYARAGYARYKTNNSGTVQGVRVRDDDGNTPMYGLGIKVNLNENFALRLEYQDYTNISRVEGDKDDIQGLFGGVSYSF
jgi:opacity protein-like surface antigen